MSVYTKNSLKFHSITLILIILPGWFLAILTGDTIVLAFILGFTISYSAIAIPTWYIMRRYFSDRTPTRHPKREAQQS